MKVFWKFNLIAFLSALFTMFLLQSTGSQSAENPRDGRHLNSENIENRDILVHDRVDTMDLYLDERNVLCTSADYSAMMLKVNIPELRLLTTLDHTNTGTGLPCVQGGVCSEENSPGSIIALGPQVSVSIHVRRYIVATIDHSNKSCQQYLRETVAADIEGRRFNHEAFGDVGSVPYISCLW